MLALIFAILGTAVLSVVTIWLTAIAVTITAGQFALLGIIITPVAIVAFIAYNIINRGW